MPRKKKPEAPQSVLGVTLKEEEGMTTCDVCHRAMREEDVDEEGRCPDCVGK